MPLVSTDASPVPAGVISGALRTADGVELRFARWAPPGEPKGTVCLFQGRAEFIEKYFEVIGELQARGFAVAALDWRGQGLSRRALSDPRKGHVGSFAEYDLDLEALVSQVVLPDCPAPYFAVGHAMGAAILLRAAALGRRWFDRMVLCAPMIAFKAGRDPPLARLSARLMRAFRVGSAYVPGGGPTPIGALPFEGNLLTSDPVRYARTAAFLQAEPGLGVGAPTYGWAHAAIAAMAELGNPRCAAAIRQPVLVIGAGADGIMSVPAIEQFGMRLGSGSYVAISGARHEMLMEQDRYRSQFWAAFDAYVPGSTGA